MKYHQLLCTTTTTFGNIFLYGAQDSHPNKSPENHGAKRSLFLDEKNMLPVAGIALDEATANSNAFAVMLIQPNIFLFRAVFDKSVPEQHIYACTLEDNIIRIISDLGIEENSMPKYSEHIINDIKLKVIDTELYYIEELCNNCQIFQKISSTDIPLSVTIKNELQVWDEYLKWYKETIDRRAFSLCTSSVCRHDNNILLKFKKSNNDNIKSIHSLSPYIEDEDNNKKVTLNVLDEKLTPKDTKEYAMLLVGDNYCFLGKNMNIRVYFEDTGGMVQYKRFKYNIDTLKLITCSMPYKTEGLLRLIRIASWLFNIKNARCLISTEPRIKDNQFHNANMNTEQKEAVLKILNTADVSFILGPPGTGKTTVIAEAIYQIAKAGKSVLLSSQSNDAIDNALQRLEKDVNIRAIRLGGRAVEKDNPYSEDFFEWNISEKIEKQISIQNSKAQECVRQYGKWADTQIMIEEKASDLLHFYKHHRDNFVEIDANDKKRYNNFWNEYKSVFLPLLSKGTANDIFPESFRDLSPKQRIRSFFTDGNTIKHFDNMLLGIQRAKKVKKQEVIIKMFDNINKTMKSIALDKDDDIKAYNSGYNTNFALSLLKTANVIAITCNSNIDKLTQFYMDTGNTIYDYTIIDEVSKATLPEILSCILRSRKTVLVGDHRQLPPVFKAEDDDISIYGKEQMYKFKMLVTNTIFKLLYDKAPDYAKCMLTKQYRMHNEINNAITSNFYMDEHNIPLLKNGLTDEQSNDGRSHSVTYKDIFSPVHHVYWIDSTPHDERNSQDFELQDGTSKYNSREIKIIKKILKIINGSLSNPVDLGVISFYSAQNKKLRQELKQVQYNNIKLDVNTVDKFQGQERQIIIVSLVRSKPKRHISRNNEFFRMYERLNVAFSRAQALLIIVGSTEFCRKQSISLPPIRMNGEDDDGEQTVGSETAIYNTIIEKIKYNNCLIDGERILADK